MGRVTFWDYVFSLDGSDLLSHWIRSAVAISLDPGPSAGTSPSECRQFPPSHPPCIFVVAACAYIHGLCLKSGITPARGSVCTCFKSIAPPQLGLALGSSSRTRGLGWLRTRGTCLAMLTTSMTIESWSHRCRMRVIVSRYCDQTFRVRRIVSPHWGGKRGQQSPVSSDS